MKKNLLVLALLFLSPYVYSAEEETAPPKIDEERLVAALQEEEKSLAESIDDATLVAAADNLGPSAAGFLSDTAGPREDDEVDPRVLRDFVESRGLIQCRQKEGTLTIAGDVRARWIAVGERVGPFKRRGFGAPIAINRFKSELNLFLDYVTTRTWATTKTKFANFLGRDGGTATKVDLERAFIGYDVWSEGEDDFYIEIGRSSLDYMFESRVQFGSNFDGIHFFYTKCLPAQIGQFTIHGGPFIVDSFTNHYAWVLETFVSKWAGTGFSLKYSLIDWHRDAPTMYYGNLDKSKLPAKFEKGLIRNNPRYRFIISQMLIGYEKKIDFLRCKTLFLYGAVLVNHDAKRVKQTNFKKANGAWYVGFTLGKLCKACDWSIDINYQSVQAQAVPEFDLSGIGHGNYNGGFLYDAFIFDYGSNDDRFGIFTNYKGWEANALYALTDTLSVRAKAQYATPRNKSIVKTKEFVYKSFEMSVIYAF